MDSSDNQYLLTINNKIIYDFYNKNTHLNIVNVNLFIVDFINAVTTNNTNGIKSVEEKLLQLLNENTSNIQQMKDSLAVMNENINRFGLSNIETIKVHLNTIKTDYINDMKLVLENVNVTTQEKISTLIDKNNNILIDKTNLLLNNSIPQNNETLNKLIQSNLSGIQLKITEYTSNLLHKTTNEKLLETFLSNIDQKYNALTTNLLQPLYGYVNSSEERLSKNISSVKNITEEYSSYSKPVFSSMNEFFGKYNVSSSKGKLSESNLYNILANMFPSSELIVTSGQKASGDIIIKRRGKPDILVENKDYKTPVDKTEVEKFYRDISNHNICGLFISQSSGISYKENYEIDIRNNNILVYISNCQFDEDKIKTAINIIDHLYTQLLQHGVVNKEFVIARETLEDINIEFQRFFAQKENMQLTVKEFNRKISSQIEELSMPSLEKYLEPFFTNIKEVLFRCPLCKSFDAMSKQSLGAHMRGCKKKYGNSANSSNDSVAEEAVPTIQINTNR